jgi:hypothetical protein
MRKVYAYRSKNSEEKVGIRNENSEKVKNVKNVKQKSENLFNFFRFVSVL